MSTTGPAKMQNALENAYAHSRNDSSVPVDDSLRRLLEELKSSSMAPFANFFPKFENETDTSNIGKRLDDGNCNCLVLSLKHSGSLYMVAAMNGKLYTFSKNGTQSGYTDIADSILRAMLLPEKFQELIQYLDDTQISLSFEAVSPAGMGDHADKPQLPYLVLTAAHQGETALQFDVVTGIAHKFGLIPNEMWIINTDDPTKTEEMLNHLSGMRQALYTELVSFLDNKSNITRLVELPQKLTHGQLQGEILEGFVCFACNADPSAIDYMKSLDFYSGSDHLVELLASLGSDIKATYCPENVGTRGGLNEGVKVPESLSPLADKATLTLTRVVGKGDPKRMKILLDELSLLEKKMGKTDADSLFQHLPNDKVTLTFLREEDKQLFGVILTIKDDRVFQQYYADHPNGWLKRGQCILLKPRGPAQPQRFYSSGFEILNIFKYKMYPYIFRTFGNRNILGHLFKNSRLGREGFLKMLEAFFGKWSVPEELQELHCAQMKAWVNYIMAHSEIHSDLKMGRYLDHFTAFEEVADKWYDEEETLPVFIMGGTSDDVEKMVRDLKGNHTLQILAKAKKIDDESRYYLCDYLPKGIKGKVVFILPEDKDSPEYSKAVGLMTSALRKNEDVFILDPGEKVASLGKNLTFHPDGQGKLLVTDKKGNKFTLKVIKSLDQL